MTKLKLLGAAALLSMAVATPASAQTAMQEPGAYAQDHPWANDYNYNYRYRSGFWPGDVRLAWSAAPSEPRARSPRRRSVAAPMMRMRITPVPTEVYDYRSTCGPQPGCHLSWTGRPLVSLLLIRLIDEKAADEAAFLRRVRL